MRCCRLTVVIIMVRRDAHASLCCFLIVRSEELGVRSDGGGAQLIKRRRIYILKPSTLEISFPINEANNQSIHVPVDTRDSVVISTGRICTKWIKRYK